MEPAQFVTLADWGIHFYKLYGQRNEFYIPSLMRRIVFLTCTAGGLRKTIRQQLEEEVVQDNLGRLLSRLYAVTNFFRDLPFSQAVARKYGASCRYCQKVICGCASDKRPKPVVPETVNGLESLGWSLREWQNHLGLLYGAVNSERNIYEVLSRLQEEIDELFDLAEDGDRRLKTGPILKEEFAFECSDVFAWICAAATRLNVDLLTVIERRYYTSCWKCLSWPCCCLPRSTRFDTVQVPSSGHSM